MQSVNCLIEPILLYGSETWTLSKNPKKTRWYINSTTNKGVPEFNFDLIRKSELSIGRNPQLKGQNLNPKA